MTFEGSGKCTHIGAGDINSRTPKGLAQQRTLIMTQTDNRGGHPPPVNDRVRRRVIIPCLPGHFELRPPGVFEDERNLRRSAVIAWEVYGRCAYPITADPGSCDEDLPYAIEFPDGHVEAQNTSWKSVQQYCGSNNLGPVELLDE